MEKAAAAGVGAGRRWESALGCCTSLLAVTLCQAAQAQQQTEPAGKAPAEAVVAQARVEPPVLVQVRTSTLPRFDAQDSGFQAPRVDVSLTPTTSSGSGLGAVLGLASPAANNNPLGMQARTSVDLGLRWTQRLQSQHQIDITAWRRMNNAPDDAIGLIQAQQPVYGARVEMNLSARSPKTSFAVDRGFIGLQLEGGARITVKRKDGRPMVYYRTTF